MNISEKKILSIIPENLREDLIKEVMELIKEREGKQVPGQINADIKSFVATQAAAAENK